MIVNSLDIVFTLYAVYYFNCVNRGINPKYLCYPFTCSLL